MCVSKAAPSGLPAIYYSVYWLLKMRVSKLSHWSIDSSGCGYTQKKSFNIQDLLKKDFCSDVNFEFLKKFSNTEVLLRDI